MTNIIWSFCGISFDFVDNYNCVDYFVCATFPNSSFLEQVEEENWGVTD